MALDLLTAVQRFLEHSILFQYTTINELVWVTLLILIVFLFRLMIRRYRLISSRAKIPFVIGGWGTRGKSGTERKKAALFHGLGFNVISKTTGCEAMIIHSKPGLNPTELPIYRPGDKSSIWEQEKVVGWSAKLKSHVLLWECMAVSPDYAGLMQHEWMHDDVSTLSNTFVDHENIQGPSGVDIPRAMEPFIPNHATLFTAEEMMIPILKLKAKQNNTPFIELPWYDSEFFASDILQLFPYRIHPRNLGMVLKIAESLGIEQDLALKEISANIVPDLGAFNRVSTLYDGQPLEFWNGMSANDRTSCMSNWQLAGFDQDDPSGKTWIITVINNRQDRISRSFEFADIITNLTPAHLHILIGTNLEGMQGYIREAAKRFASQHAHLGEAFNSLQPEQMKRRLTEIIDHMLEWMRVDGRSKETIRKKCFIMIGSKVDPDRIDGLISDLIERRMVSISEVESACSGLGLSPQETSRLVFQLSIDIPIFLKIIDFKSLLNQYSIELNRKISSKQKLPFEAAYARLLAEILESKIYIIWNPFATGDQIIDTILGHSPAGHTLKIIGMQNIKGTGLDFAYRWVSLATVQRAVEQLSSDNLEIRKTAVERLASHDDYGILDIPVAIEALKTALARPENSVPEIRNVIEDALRKLAAVAETKKARLDQGGRSRFRRFWSSFFEQLLDAGDSRRRYRRWNRIMKDLFEERISQPKAAKLLHDLNKRQEGGWLLKIGK